MRGAGTLSHTEMRDQEGYKFKDEHLSFDGTRLEQSANEHELA